jgi:hypothetical protein
MRRRRRREIEGHQIYLLDTMNNVLGILILVLILTKLILPEVEERSSQQRDAEVPLANMMLPPPVTENDVSEKELLLRKLRDELAARESRMSTRESETATLERQRAELKIKLAGLIPGGPGGNRADVEESLARLEEEQSRLRDDLRQARSRLEEVTRSGPIDANRIVTVSVNPGEGGFAVDIAPSEVTFVCLVCYQGRVLPRDTRTLEDARLAAFKSVVESKGNATTYRDITTHFETKDVGDEYFRVKVISVQDDKGQTFVVRHEPREHVGEPLAALRSPGSMTERLLSSLDRSKTVVLFQVWADSFDVYLETRRVADAKGLRCGWEPYASDQWLQFHLNRGGGSRPEIDPSR